MWDPTKFDGMSVGFSSEGTRVFKCSDFPKENCCTCCHTNNFIIAIYPWSCYSVTKNRMPDLGAGVRAEVCCGQFNGVRLLPREWWIYRYAEKEGWNQEEAERLCHAAPNDYYKVWGQISDSHYAKTPATRTGASARPRTSNKAPSGLRSRLNADSKCPSCGSTWDRAICNQCGYEG